MYDKVYIIAKFVELKKLTNVVYMYYNEYNKVNNKTIYCKKAVSLYQKVRN